MIGWALWLLTSAYSTQLGIEADGEMCIKAAVLAKTMIEGKSLERPFLYRLVCIPTIVSLRTEKMTEPNSPSF